MKFKNWQELTSERKAREPILGTFLLFSLYPFSSPFVKSLIEMLRDSVEMKDLTHLF